jgi:hypothetical protein
MEETVGPVGPGWNYFEGDGTRWPYGEFYEFYSVSPEYFGYTLVPSTVFSAPSKDEQEMLETCRGP